MLLHHLGKNVDVDPTEAAFENKILEVLRERGPSKQVDVYLACRRSPIFFDALDSLVNRGLVIRETTTRKNSFILKVAEVQR